jgi:hypothetical protein
MQDGRQEVRERIISLLRDVFGREREERETPLAPSAVIERNLPKIIPTIWGRADLGADGRRVPAWVLQERHEFTRHARIDGQVLAAMRHLNCPAGFVEIALTHWLNTDSVNYPVRFHRTELAASLARLKARGQIVELTRFWGRKKWVAGNLLELLARAADGQLRG